MNPGDKIIVYENQNYDNRYTVSIAGEVKKAGSFPWENGMTVEDLISAASGLRDHTKINLHLEEFISSVSEDGQILTESSLISNIDMNTKISNGAKLTILPTENIVKVIGNVYNPGLIAFDGGNVNNYIEYAGGKSQKQRLQNIYYAQMVK